MPSRDPRRTFPILLTAILVAGSIFLSCARNTVLPLAVPLDPPGSAAASGTYRSAFSLALEAPQADALVRYTLNPTAPVENRSAWTYYSVPIPVDRSLRVRAYAYVLEANPSPVKTIDLELKVPDPVPDTAPGPLAGASLNLSWTCALTGAQIRYTVDGSVPTAASALFSAGTPIALAADTVVRAKAFYGGWTDSDTAGGLYDLLNSAGFTISIVMPDGTITFGNAVAPLIYNVDTMNVWVSILTNISSPTYVWYLNGAVIPGATANSIDVGASGPAGLLEAGFYSLTLEAVAGGYSYSETIAFEVTN